jgi:hypothetical protein
VTDFFGAMAEKFEPLASDVLRAPLFGSLISGLHIDNCRVILDLGSARAATVDLFNRYSCRLDIADLSTGLDVLNSQKDPGLLREQVESMFPACGQEATDVVLCWDLLNYLQRPALTAVMERIASRARRGTLVHALIIYSSRRMPTIPRIYFPCKKPGDESGNFDHLTAIPVTIEECDAPQYSPDYLKRCMQGYYIERAILLSNGMQEFLFRIS